MRAAGASAPPAASCPPGASRLHEVEKTRRASCERRMASTAPKQRVIRPLAVHGSHRAARLRWLAGHDRPGLRPPPPPAATTPAPPPGRRAARPSMPGSAGATQERWRHLHGRRSSPTAPASRSASAPAWTRQGSAPASAHAVSRCRLRRHPVASPGSRASLRHPAALPHVSTNHWLDHATAPPNGDSAPPAARPPRRDAGAGPGRAHSWSPHRRRPTAPPGRVARAATAPSPQR
ncbi:hypothetical protein NB710_000702 [Xanthomonas sacchari]|nr:hypothetical protein [Xanthomonas sacchari]